MSTSYAINDENSYISEIDSLSRRIDEYITKNAAGGRGGRPKPAPAKPAPAKPAPKKPAPAKPAPPAKPPTPVSGDRLTTLKAIPANSTPISAETSAAVRNGEIKIKFDKSGELIEIRLSDRLKKIKPPKKNILDQDLANLIEQRKAQSAAAKARAAARRAGQPQPAPGAAPAAPAPAPPVLAPGEQSLEGGKFKFKLDDNGFIDPTSITVSDDIRQILANKPTMRERFSRNPATQAKVSNYDATRQRITSQMASIQSQKIAELKTAAVLNSNFERAKASLLMDIDRIVNKPGLLGTNKRKIAAGASVLAVVGLLYKTLSGNSVRSADPVKQEILTQVNKKGNFDKEELLKATELSSLTSEFISALNELKTQSNAKTKTLISSHVADLGRIKTGLDTLSKSLDADNTSDMSSMMSNLGSLDNAMSLYLPKLNTLYKRLSANELEDESSMAEDINENYKSYISIIRQAKNSLKS